MKIALVYDRVNKFGGAERVLTALHEIWPEAPLFTSVYDADGASWAKDWDIRTTFLQKFPWARRNHESLGWLMPSAFESFDLSEFDVVISVTSEAAKGVITTPKQLHICYLLTPTRYLWSHAQKYLILLPRVFRSETFVAQIVLRQWDYLAAQRPDHIIAISELVRRRCEKYYRRKASVIYPPMMLEGPEVSGVSKVSKASFKRSDLGVRQGRTFPEGYFLVVSRLVPYKCIDLTIEAANKLREPLLVIGSGTEKKRLHHLSGPTVRFIENISDEELVEYYRNARALLMPQEEDFGLVALEAQACGTPVVSYRQSGVAEVIIDGKTGRLFDRQDVSSLIHALKDCPKDPKACTIQANRFQPEDFKRQFKQEIERRWETHQKNISSR